VLSTRGIVLAVGAAAAAIAGFSYGVEEFVLLAVAAAVLLILGAAWVRVRERAVRTALRVVVTVPVPEVAAGTPAVIDMTVTNAGARRLPPISVEDAAGHWGLSHPGLREHRTDPGRRVAQPRPKRARDGRDYHGDDRKLLSRVVRLPDLRAGASVTLRVPAPTAARGLLTLSQVGLWCEDPLRLFSRRATTAPPAHVVVYPVPAAPSRHSQADAAAGRHGRADRARRASLPDRHAGAPSTAATLSGDELSGLRPYVPGDRLTRLHWQTLARSGDLVVREFVDAETDALALLVDLRPTSHSGDSIEHAVSRAAGLGVAALARGQAVELCTSTGDRVSITPGTAGHGTLLRALAMLGPANPPPSVAMRYGDRPGAGAVWATGRLDTGTVVLVTTAAGDTGRALPEPLRHRAETVLVS